MSQNKFQERHKAKNTRTGARGPGTFGVFSGRSIVLPLRPKAPVEPEKDDHAMDGGGEPQAKNYGAANGGKMQGGASGEAMSALKTGNA